MPSMRGVTPYSQAPLLKSQMVPCTRTQGPVPVLLCRMLTHIPVFKRGLGVNFAVTRSGLMSLMRTTLNPMRKKVLPVKQPLLERCRSLTILTGNRQQLITT